MCSIPSRLLCVRKCAPVCVFVAVCLNLLSYLKCQTWKQAETENGKWSVFEDQNKDHGGRLGEAEDRMHETFGRWAGMSQLIADGKEEWECCVSR